MSKLINIALVSIPLFFTSCNGFKDCPEGKIEVTGNADTLYLPVNL